MLDVAKAVGTSPYFWIALVAIVAMAMFRAPLTAFISRIVRINRKEGITAVGPTQDQVQDPRKAADELLRYLDNEYIVFQENQLRAELIAKGIAADPAEMARVLTRFTASAMMLADFERIDRLIWGNQIELLSSLNGATMASRDQLLPYYQKAVDTEPLVSQGYPFDNYLAFLMNNGLIAFESGSYVITIKGRAFLMFLIHSRRPFERAL